MSSLWSDLTLQLPQYLRNKVWSVKYWGNRGVNLWLPQILCKFTFCGRHKASVPRSITFPQNLILHGICGDRKSDRKLDICGRLLEGFVRLPLFLVLYVVFAAAPFTYNLHSETCSNLIWSSFPFDGPKPFSDCQYKYVTYFSCSMHQRSILVDPNVLITRGLTGFAVNTRDS